MSDENSSPLTAPTTAKANTTLRSIELDRQSKGQYVATNVRGGTLAIGSGDDDDFTPVELLLAAMAACSAIDVDFITAKRAEPERFRVHASGDKVKDEASQGSRMANLALNFDVSFADDEAGQAAESVLPRSIHQSHDRLCTVSRTIELGSPVEVSLRSEAL